MRLVDLPSSGERRPMNSCMKKRPMRVPVSIVVRMKQRLEHDREVVPVREEASPCRGGR